MLKNRESTLWRYRELLPVKDQKNIVCLGEGMTPLLSLKNLGSQVGIPNLYMKDEGILPTGTFKARRAAVGVSRVEELGVKVLAMPTNSNTGEAWAAYCAPAGIEAVSVLSEDAPPMPSGECAIASLYLVKGLISDAGITVPKALGDFLVLDAIYKTDGYALTVA